MDAKTCGSCTSGRQKIGEAAGLLVVETCKECKGLCWHIVDDDGEQLTGTEATNELDAWRKCAHQLEVVYSEAIARSGFDISVCHHCGVPVVCLPDGLAMCEACAMEENQPKEKDQC